MTAPEFSRPERVDQIGTTPHSVSVTASAEERAALARRFGLPAIDKLEASIAVNREGAAIRVTGRVIAHVKQACVVTDAPLPATVDEPIDLRFVTNDVLGEEAELEGDQIDTIAYDGGAIDLGEAAAETMALALDPFPRAPDADAVLRAAGVKGEAEAGPFGALAALKDKLGGAQSS